MKAYISPEFEFIKIEILDPICSSPVENDKSTNNTDPNTWETWGDSSGDNPNNDLSNISSNKW